MASKAVLVLLIGVALIVSPLVAGESRDRVRAIKAAALDSGDEAVQAVAVLEEEGLLTAAPRGPVSKRAEKASQTLASSTFGKWFGLGGNDDEDTAKAASGEAAAASAGLDWRQARQAAVEYFKASDEFKRQRYSGCHCPEHESWVKKTSDGGYKVTVMPISLGIVGYYCSYVIFVDASGKVTKMK